jgi:hypothetical protein
VVDAVPNRNQAGAKDIGTKKEWYMKYLKILGLAVVAATALMAFGAGTASATFCKVNESPCAAGNQYPTHTTIKAHSAKAVLSGSLEVTCESDVTLLNESISGGKLIGKVTALTWSNCKGACSSAVTNAPLPTFEDEATGKGNGKTIIKNTSVTLTCFFGFVKCIAKAATASLSLTGGVIGSTATAAAVNVPTVIEGPESCGKEGLWNGSYTINEVNGSKAGSIFIV